MERLKERLDIATKAVATLRELDDMDLPTIVKRDAAILRFVHAYEAVWRAAQRHLIEAEGIELGTPNGTIRGCRDAGLLSDAETEAALQMTRDRNLAVHTYNERLAEDLSSRLPRHVEILSAWLAAMKAR